MKPRSASQDSINETPDGFMVAHGGRTYGPYRTHAEAWKKYDRLAGEPHTRKEAAHDWSFRELANRE